jgi:hypothetical protein
LVVARRDVDEAGRNHAPATRKIQIADVCLPRRLAQPRRRALDHDDLKVGIDGEQAPQTRRVRDRQRGGT